ncbi:hypothetical protein [Pseudomonas syringae]|uniref:hypothetical protein n=1 Tax=Pseudomonas syringae TaxID=317 RepID=UPI001BCC0415|nr:hypothetical protein [Pseudomonas syringae]QVI69418.1 hypothetical protein KHW12_20050 [Pseudomonas syringae]
MVLTLASILIIGSSSMALSLIWALTTCPSLLAGVMPALFWGVEYRMPKGLRYAPGARYASPEVAHLEPRIIEKMVPFLAACHARMAQSLVKLEVGKWLATSPASIKKAAIKGDPWVSAVMRY